MKPKSKFNQPFFFTVAIVKQWDPKNKFPEHQGRVSAFEINAIKNAPPPSVYLLYYYTTTVLSRLSPCLMSHLLHHGEAKNTQLSPRQINMLY